ncbi:MAG: hypothetical protein WCK63_14905 [Betaproteobacteria bacterium]
MGIIQISCRIIVASGLFLILLLLGLLYAPFSGNPAVFDDHNIITNLSVFSFAQEVFSKYPRTFPYFSIGLVHVLSDGGLEWNHHLSVLLHGLNVVALFFFLSRVTERIGTVEGAQRQGVLCFVCLWIAINPAAVYGVGYLAQRTILFATLFGLLSAILYLRAQLQERNSDLFSATLFAGLSVMSKEHAILLPLAVVVLTPMVCEWSKAAIGRALGYLLLSLPCAVWVLFHSGKDIVGTSYEIYSGQVVSQFQGLGIFDFPGGIWVMSISTQLLLFWKYLFLWLIPNTQWMSVDMRVDFFGLWSSAWTFAGVMVSLGIIGTAAIVWLRPKSTEKVRQWSAALLFAAIPFVVELSVVKVQEPFVLYRSYLWMPAYALLLCLVLNACDERLSRLMPAFPRRAFWLVLVLAGAALFPLSQERLRSFSSEEALWQDALLKLPHPDVAGADRIYYNLAGEAFKRKDFPEALRFSDLVVKQNPSAFQGYLAKGTSLLALGNLDAAWREFDVAEAHAPPPDFLGYIEAKRCNVLEIRGEGVQALACLKRSARMGYGPSRFRLQMMGVDEKSI